MISFQKQFLFVHIPKTAGNSIQSILRDYSEDEIVALRGEQDGIERFGLRNPKYKIRKHSTLAEYRAALEEERFHGLYKFTCVRNPWDRMVSYYFRPTRHTGAWDRKEFRKLVLRTLSVADYLRLYRGEADSFGNVDYIMRFENLAEDFRVVCATLGIPPVPAAGARAPPLFLRAVCPGRPPHRSRRGRLAPAGGEQDPGPHPRSGAG